MVTTEVCNRVIKISWKLKLKWIKQHKHNKKKEKEIRQKKGEEKGKRNWRSNETQSSKFSCVVRKEDVLKGRAHPKPIIIVSCDFWLILDLKWSRTSLSILKRYFNSQRFWAEMIFPLFLNLYRRIIPYTRTTFRRIGRKLKKTIDGWCEGYAKKAKPNAQEIQKRKQVNKKAKLQPVDLH